MHTSHLPAAAAAEDPGHLRWVPFLSSENCQGHRSMTLASHSSEASQSYRPDGTVSPT